MKNDDENRASYVVVQDEPKESKFLSQVRKLRESITQTLEKSAFILSDSKKNSILNQSVPDPFSQKKISILSEPRDNLRANNIYAEAPNLYNNESASHQPLPSAEQINESLYSVVDKKKSSPDAGRTTLEESEVYQGIYEMGSDEEREYSVILPKKDSEVK